ncbi:MAG: sulfur carrier protein ThiS adenylyltransferase ThiF [Bacteroidales bacterium]|nr:sulfur carrier protein ThiS adenylyltransferase ThiF [Bacteroidales bacterium]
MDTKQIETILQTKTIGIAGCGGLGSNCAALVARAGIGKLVLADFDKVEAPNLSRQYFFRSQVGLYKIDALRQNLLQLNPALIIETHCLRLTDADIASLFIGCDVVVEAFDDATAKLMLIETMALELPATPLVVGNGVAGWGNNNSITTLRADKNLYICGDGILETSQELPPLAPRLMVVAAMQANQVLEILLNNTI